jgi:rhomboid family GlyGly-CTERM serine protease
VVVLGCIALTAVAPIDQFAYERAAILAGEWWRLWTGHGVHYSTRQAGIDIGALFLVGAVAERECGTRFTAWVLALGLPALSIGLLLVAPDLVEYRGASGLDVMLAVLAGTALWRSVPAWRFGLAVLGSALAAKTVLEATGWAPNLSSLPANIQVAWQAHALGGVIGWGFACFKPGKSPQLP